MRRLIPIVIFSCFLPVSAFAFQEQAYSTETFSQTFVYPNIRRFSPPPAGGLGWDVFTTTKEDFTYGTGGQKDFILASHPKFSSDMEAYDGKEVLMSGYMFPLEDSDMQDQFLFGPFPMTCPFHYHVPATLVIETHVKDPVLFTYDPILLRGRLELVRDLGHEPYYRMQGAVLETSRSLVTDDTKPVKEKSFHPLFRASPMEIKKREATIPDSPSAGDYKAQ